MNSASGVLWANVGKQSYGIFGGFKRGLGFPLFVFRFPKALRFLPLHPIAPTKSLRVCRSFFVAQHFFRCLIESNVLFGPFTNFETKR